MSHSVPLQQFILEHLESDTDRLLLAAGRYRDIPVPYAVVQIKALRKVRDKIPGWFDPALVFPSLVSVEQSSSELTARYKASLLQGGAVLDLSGGLGVDTYYISKRFERSVYVEKQADLAAAARNNFSLLDAGHIRVVASEARDYLHQTKDFYDWVYLDPARRDRQQRKTVLLEDCEPNVLELKSAIWEHSSALLLKTSPLLDIRAALQDLAEVVAVHVVAVQNDCKELLFVLKKNAAVTPEEVPIHSVNLESGQPPFTHTLAEEQASGAVCSLPGKYLIEPNAAILKSGAFRTFAARFHVKKLHPNTHLYTTDRYPSDMPGRCFDILQVERYDRKAVRSHLPEARANIAVRNFPDTVAGVRKRLQLADGGDTYLFAATHSDNKPCILICRKLAGNVLSR